MDSQDALMWLANLKQGENYVLDLRNHCLGRSKCSDPQCGDSTWDHFCDLGGHDKTCCQGRGWMPKQGRDALHDAMLKAGWYSEIHQAKDRFVMFYRSTQRSGITGEGADDDLAAVKAMKAAGH